jgi:predicted permease
VTYALLFVAFALGFSLRKRIGDRFRIFYRGQAVVLGAPLALLSGWSFVWRVTSLLTLLCLLVAELIMLFIALRLLQRGRISPVTAMASSSNTGFWAQPIAGALFGPSGTAFAVVTDIAGFVFPFIIVRTLRTRAPEKPSRRSAVVDYLPAVALVVGLGLQFIRAIPVGAKNTIPLLAVLLGCVGFLALGAAMPDNLPTRRDFVAALPVIPLRFTLPFLTMLALWGAGIDVPGGAWVIALAPNAFVVVVMARLYGYDRRQTAALPLLTIPISVILLPLVAALGSA